MQIYNSHIPGFDQQQAVWQLFTLSAFFNNGMSAMRFGKLWHTTEHIIAKTITSTKKKTDVDRNVLQKDMQLTLQLSGVAIGHLDQGFQVFFSCCAYLPAQQFQDMSSPLTIHCQICLLDNYFALIKTNVKYLQHHLLSSYSSFHLTGRKPASFLWPFGLCFHLCFAVPQ